MLIAEQYRLRDRIIYRGGSSFVRRAIDTFVASCVDLQENMDREDVRDSAQVAVKFTKRDDLFSLECQHLHTLRHAPVSSRFNTFSLITSL